MAQYVTLDSIKQIKLRKEIQDVKQNSQTMQEAQRSVLAAIKDNQTMMLHVANHIKQMYLDGGIGFVPPHYVQEENVLPSDPSTNSTVAS